MWWKLEYDKLTYSQNLFFRTIGLVVDFSPVSSLVSTASVDDGNWHHVAITMHARWYNWFNGPYQRYERIIECTYLLYVDGVLQGTLAQQKNVGSAPSPAMRRFTNSASTLITVGNIGNGSSAVQYQDGFDDFRYYSTLLTAAEIGQLATETACSGTSGVTAATQDITVLLDANGQATITAEDIDNGRRDACRIQSMSVAPNSFGCENIGIWESRLWVGLKWYQ